MELRRIHLGLLYILLYMSSGFLNQCEARGSKQAKSSVIKYLDMLSPSDTYSIDSSSSLPSYCVYPPFTPMPPSTAPTQSPPPPSPLLYYSPPPPSPLFYYSPPKFPPNPPVTESSPPFYIPGPPQFVPGPPLFLPPIVYPPPLTPPPSGGGTLPGLWCVAKPTVPEPIIQEAMDYACGSGADCDSIQPSGSCYQPDTLLAHASFAFNSYWQRTKVAGGTCDFGGTAMLITVDPSYDGCHFNLM